MTSPKTFLALCGLVCFSSFAFASTIAVSNAGGTLSPSPTGLVLTGGSLVMVSGLGAPYDGNVSGDSTTFSFSIGTPTFGSTTGTSASWTSGGGSFDFKDNTTGLVFTGSFTCSATSPCTWFKTTGSASVGIFFASFDGTLNGKPIVGGTAQLNVSGINSSNNGVTVATVVPEVGTLGMVGIGLLGIAGFVKLKLSSASKKAA